MGLAVRRNEMQKSRKPTATKTATNQTQRTCVICSIFVSALVGTINSCRPKALYFDCKILRHATALNLRRSANFKIVSWDNPSSSVLACTSLTVSGRVAAIARTRSINAPSSRRSSVAILFQCRNPMLLKRYSPPIFIASFTLRRLAARYGRMLARS